MNPKNNIKIVFSVVGNQENPVGNPIGYHRATQGSRWTDQAKRYEAWKQIVQHACVEHVPSGYFREKMIYRIATGKKPFGQDMVRPKTKIQCHVLVHWANDSHADPDNILKAVNDALFENDKYVACSVDFDDVAGAPGKIDITITLPL